MKKCEKLIDIQNDRSEKFTWTSDSGEQKMQDIIKRVFFLSVLKIFRLKKELTTLTHKCITKQEFISQYLLIKHWSATYCCA